MNKLKDCPLCGGETILCKESSMYTIPQFSIICLGCGIEFKMRYDPTANGSQYIIDPKKAAIDIIEKFNSRKGETHEDLV